MTMSFLLHESFGELEPSELGSGARQNDTKRSFSTSQPITATDEKFRIPEIGDAIRRERLLELLERSMGQYGATLVSGRAGTGKTVLAASFAARHRNSSWFTVEPSDIDWVEFSAAFEILTSVRRKSRSRSSAAIIPNEPMVSRLLTQAFNKLSRRKDAALLIIDNAHHLFDAAWFPEFFKQLIASLNDRTRLLMMCRSKPNAPLWRMRSKQMLNVIDENILYFTNAEAIELCRARGLPQEFAAEAVKRSFGQPSRLTKLVNDACQRNTRNAERNVS